MSDYLFGMALYVIVVFSIALLKPLQTLDLYEILETIPERLHAERGQYCLPVFSQRSVNRREKEGTGWDGKY